MLAVVPAQKLDFTPLRLKIAITSDFDKQSPDAEAQGWFAFSNYMDWLKSRGVQHSAQVVTKMKFDPNAAYPKIFFAAERWLEPGEVAQVAPVTKSEDVQKLLGGTFTPAGVDGVNKNETTATPQPEPEAKPAAAPVNDDDDDGEIIMGLDAPAAEPVQEPAQAKKAPPETPKAKAAPKAAAAPPVDEAPAVSKDPDLAALLADWGDA
jgi:hypothetical protein